MLTKLEIESKLQAIKPVLIDKFHVSTIGYFGSYSTGQQNEQSDLDLLVEFSQPVGWEFFTLEQTLGLRVDLVTHNSLKEQIKESILNQVQYI